MSKELFGHGRLICSKCEKVIKTCRCMDCSKTTEYDICDTCKKGETQPERKPAIR